MTRKRIHRPQTRGDPTAGDDAGSIARPPPGGRVSVLADFKNVPRSERERVRPAAEARAVSRNGSVCLCSFMPPRQTLQRPLETVAATPSFLRSEVMRCNRFQVVLIMAAVSLFALATSAGAAIIVTPDHIVSGSATGTLVAIDVPHVATPAYGGPDWPDDADDGFTTANDGIMEPMGTSRWEPDGTPIGEAGSYFTYGNGPVPGVKWTFNTAASGIDIPDDSIINAIYATWNTRNRDGITYQYTEGAASDSIVRQTGGAAPAADLVLSWVDSLATTRNGNFERIFSTPITVTGGDGFELWGTDNIGNAAHIDAVVLDVTLPGGPVIPEPSTFVIWALGLLALAWYGWRSRGRSLRVSTP